MNRISSEDEVLRLINDNEMVVVYFTGRDCGACEAIKFKIKSILRTLPNIGCRDRWRKKCRASSKVWSIFFTYISTIY